MVNMPSYTPRDRNANLLPWIPLGVPAHEADGQTQAQLARNPRTQQNRTAQRSPGVPGALSARPGLETPHRTQGSSQWMQRFRKACYGQASKLALPELTGQQSGARFTARGGGSRQHKRLLPSALFLLPASGMSLNHNPEERKTKPKNMIKQKRKSGDAWYSAHHSREGGAPGNRS